MFLFSVRSAYSSALFEQGGKTTSGQWLKLLAAQNWLLHDYEYAFRTRLEWWARCWTRSCAAFQHNSTAAAVAGQTLSRASQLHTSAAPELCCFPCAGGGHAVWHGVARRGQHPAPPAALRLPAGPRAEPAARVRFCGVQTGRRPVRRPAPVQARREADRCGFAKSTAI